MPNLLPNTRHSPDILQKLDGGISNLTISGQSFINEICLNSRSSHDIDVKLGPTLKLGKRNIEILKEIKDDVISANCDIFFSIY